MISKIIQKEKARQDFLFKDRNDCPKAHYQACMICDNIELKMKFHKQSLINLKEYLEELRPVLEILLSGDSSYWCEAAAFNYTQFHEDIDELNKMIERYE